MKLGGIHLWEVPHPWWNLPSIVKIVSFVQKLWQISSSATRMPWNDTNAYKLISDRSFNHIYTLCHSTSPLPIHIIVFVSFYTIFSQLLMSSLVPCQVQSKLKRWIGRGLVLWQRAYVLFTVIKWQRSFFCIWCIATQSMFWANK